MIEHLQMKTLLRIFNLSLSELLLRLISTALINFNFEIPVKC